MKHLKPLVSIIMNCYNGEKFLLESILSVRKQTYKNWELIFFDNSSSDNSKNIVKSIKDRRIKFYSTNKTHKLYKARNLAIKKTKGEYICFLDTDDYWNKNFLNQFIKKFNNKECSIVCSKYKVRDMKNHKIFDNVKRKLPNVLTTQNLLNNYTIGILAIMLKKKIFKNYKFNDRYQVIGDFDLFIRLSSKFKIFSLNKSLAVYRLHGDNFSERKIKIYLSEIDFWFNNFKKKELKKYNLSKIKFLMIKLKIKSKLKKLNLL